MLHVSHTSVNVNIRKIRLSLQWATKINNFFLYELCVLGVCGE
jgi:hypothetical protein